MADFIKSYALVKKYEGGWCNVAGDAGGETYAGIARNFFPLWAGWGVVDAEKKHPSFKRGAAAFSAHLVVLLELQEWVRAWYEKEWWNKLGLAPMPQALADEIFEQSVNLGKGGHGKYLQRVCNAFNYDASRQARLFADLKEDGAIGQKTLAAIAMLLRTNLPEKAFVHALNGMQVAHYVASASAKPSLRKFTVGWMTRTHDPKEL